MKRVFGTGIPLKWICILLLLALAALLLPMLKAAQYDVPSSDDYPNTIDTYRAWTRTGSIFEVLKASAARIRNLYDSWQGTYSAILLFTLNPMIFGERYYGIGVWINIGMLLAGLFFLIDTIWRRVFKATVWESGIIAAVVSILCTQFLPRANQAFYWFTGSVYYTFFFGLAAVTYAVLLRYLFRDADSRGWGKLTAASLLLLIVGGGNLVTGLVTALLLVTTELLLILFKRSESKPMVIPVLCFFIGFAVNVAAPGNAARQRHLAQPGLFRAVLLSFRETWLSLGTWFTLPVIILILFLIPVLRGIASRSVYRFRLPGLVTAYSVCLTAAMFYPPIYAETERALKSLSRLTNIIFYGMILLAVFNLFYWIGWLSQKALLPDRLFPASSHGRYSLLLSVLIAGAFAFGMTQIKWFDVTSISAYRSYRSGEMGSYWHTYKLRLEILKDPEVSDAVLKRFPYRPYVLFHKELSENPEGNKDIARWYGKNSVVIR